MRFVDNIFGGIFLALIIPLVVVFVRLRRKLPRDKDVEDKISEDLEAGRSTAIFLSGAYRFTAEWIGWVLNFVEKPLGRLSPNIVTSLGLALGVASGIFYSLEMVFAGAMFLALGGLADAADGRIARRRGEVSKAGAFLDSAFDRISESVIFLGIILGPFSDKNYLAFLSALALASAMLVSYTRARGESLGIKYKEGFMRRHERAVVIVLASILEGFLRNVVSDVALALGIGIVAIGSIITAVLRIKDIYRGLKV